MNSSKIVAITVVVILGFSVVNWIQSDRRLDVRSTLPLLHGPETPMYSWGGVGLAVLAIWGLARLYGSRADEPAETEDEADEDPETTEELDEPPAEQAEDEDEPEA